MSQQPNQVRIVPASSRPDACAWTGGIPRPTRRLRLPALGIAAAFSLAISAWSPSSLAQNERDFIFADDEGYLILRFTGSYPDGLGTEQMAEVVNASVSTMVHDRLRADVLFDSEPEDPAWAAMTVPRIVEQLLSVEPDFTAIDVECHAMTCRLVLEHAQHLTVADHQSLMGSVQALIRSFVDEHPQYFESNFLIAAYEQETETPAIKAYLTRADAGPDAGAGGTNSGSDPGSDE